MKRVVYSWDKLSGMMREYRSRRAHADAPFIIPDSIKPTEHPATGKMTDSRSVFKRMTKASGFEEREGRRVADNEPKFKSCTDDDYAAAAKSAYEQCQSGMSHLNEYEREVCKRINERLKNR
jgi:hypothetical protein